MKQAKKHRTRRSPRHSRYLYQKLEWLYVHSVKARMRFWYAVLIAPAIYAFRHKLTLYRQTFSKTYRNYRLLRTGLAFVFLAVISVIFQMAYPQDRALPLTRLEGGGYVGMQFKTEISQKLDGIDRQKITIQVENNSMVTNFVDMGIELDEQATLNQLNGYSRSQKWIPFSIFFVGSKTQPIIHKLNDQKLNEFIDKLAINTYKKPVDARIERQGTALIVKPAKDGRQYNLQNIRNQLLSLGFTVREPVVIKPEVLLPQISTNLANDKAEFMQRRIDSTLTIWAGDKSLRADSQMIASWVDIKSRPQQGTIDVTLNKSRIAASLASFSSILEVASRPSVSTFLNGTLAGTVDGASGYVLKFSELVDRVASSTDWSIKSIAAEVEAILPKQNVIHSYSRNSRGIQSLIDRWALDNGGRYSIYMKTLNGNIEANINPYLQLPDQGINRLYIAHLIYGRLAANSLSLNSLTSAGMSVDSCLEYMLVNAYQGCAYALGDIVGWESNNIVLMSQGFEGTTLLRGLGYTTASDAAKWLIKVQGSSLVTASQSGILVNKLSRYSLRSGMPTGSSGIVVAGTTGENKQEIGLIFHPRGTYVLSVLSSDNIRPSAIAGLVAEINRVLNE